ncbi:DUF4440 domain-containing protein [Corynebacterium poyangense]|uniref:ribonuclease H n=1 Tax=Corynebacterium poyangense TaxID=2684405 RepID=A0A7H0SN54_9CORY|nr:ribonuclease H [Corynebacterium poyangense]QNQ89979.1 DUF4440 domain-containing protein [Corynebacterium poyangense]
MTIIAAADGSALGNPGPAGWAWYIDADTWAAGGWPQGTNNQGELQSVAHLLESTADVEEDLLIYCDSQYVINSVTKWMPGWKRKGWRKKDGKPVLNVELLQAIDSALHNRSGKVEFRWVKGHAGHELNEIVDQKARAAATAYSRNQEPDRGPGFGPNTHRPNTVSNVSATATEPTLFDLPEQSPEEKAERRERDFLQGQPPLLTRITNLLDLRRTILR